NPYLAQTVMLAAGIKGLEDKMTLAAATTGDVYEDAKASDIPQTLRSATESLRNSDFLRDALGDDVVNHYTRAAEWEQEEFDRVVTDWEIARGFERA
ncbi:MAG: glutamine synthetase, partial [Celeribacter marinus]